MTQIITNRGGGGGGGGTSYTAGTGIDITSNVISVDEDVVQTVGNMVDNLSGADDDHYPTAKAVADAISGGGLGDVIGPNSSTDGDVVLFDGATGKLIKDSGKSLNDITNIYGESDTAGATAVKEVSIPSITELNVGQQIVIKTLVTNTAAATTLKLNNFNTYEIIYNNASLTTTTDGYVWGENKFVTLLFDGTYRQVVSTSYDVNTTYTQNVLIDAGKYTAGTGTYAITRYSLVMEKTDGTWEKITDTSANYSTAKTKSVNTNGFRLNHIRYYASTTAYANGALLATNILQNQAASVNSAYSFNCGTAPGWAIGDYIYLVGNLGADGLFYLDTTNWWSNALPNTADGKLYIRLGMALTDADATMSFLIDRPIYYYDNGIKEYHEGVSDTAYSSSWDGVTNEAPSKNAVYDKLNDMDTQISNLMAQGRFLSLWNCATGMPISFPLTTPYTYHTGDYFMVETLDTNDPATNYRPNGSSYTGTASTTVESDEVAVGDYYVYDGTVWLLATNHGKAVSFANLAGSPSDNTALNNALNAKADDNAVVKLTGNQSIAGTKTFSTSPVVPSKTTDATNTGTAIATEAQVYKVAQQLGYTVAITEIYGVYAKQIKFLTVDYSQFLYPGTMNYAKISAMSCDTTENLIYSEDIYVGVKGNGEVECKVLKSMQFNGSAGIIDNGTRYYGDVFYVVDTVNQTVDFYLVTGAGPDIYMTPIIKVGNSTLTGFTQQSGTGVEYSSGTRVWAEGNASTLALESAVERPVRVSAQANNTIDGIGYLWAGTQERFNNLTLANNTFYFIHEFMGQLKFTANTANSTVQLTKVGTPTEVTLQTSTDGETWTNYTIGDTITLASEGDYVCFRNSSATDTGFSTSSGNYYKFVMSGSISASGDVTTLLNKNGTQTASASCFRQLFENCTALTTCPRIPITTNASACFREMFSGCTALTTIPALYGLTWEQSTAREMFYGCTLLKLSTQKEDEYVNPWKYPIEGIGSGQPSLGMFSATGGVISQPEPNTQYYSANTIIY